MLAVRCSALSPVHHGPQAGNAAGIQNAVGALNDALDFGIVNLARIGARGRYLDGGVHQHELQLHFSVEKARFEESTWFKYTNVSAAETTLNSVVNSQAVSSRPPPLLPALNARSGRNSASAASQARLSFLRERSASRLSQSGEALAAKRSSPRATNIGRSLGSLSQTLGRICTGPQP